MTESTLQVVQSSGEAFHIHISEATHNLLDRLGVYFCEESGLTQIKVQLLPALFYVVIYGIRWPGCSTNSQHFVNSHAFTSGKTAVLCDTHTHKHTYTHTHTHTYTHTHTHTHTHTLEVNPPPENL